MLNKNEPVSAFAVYSMKRKNSATSLASKKAKKKHKSVDNASIDSSFKNQTGKKKQLKPKISKEKSGLKSSNQTSTVPPKTKNNSIQNSYSANVLKKKKSIQDTNSKKNRNVRTSTLNNVNNKKHKAQNSENHITPKEKRKMQKLKLRMKKEKLSKKQNMKIPILPQSKVINDITEDPVADATSLFKWLIFPLSIKEFFGKHWEQQPLFIKRNKPNYYGTLMSTPLLDRILRDHHILFTENIDITSYSNGIRETHNPPGRAVPSVVWDYYLNGCSVRMLNPQTYIPRLHTLNATLQEYFGCFVGANSYLTPPDSQGFAPHYDDIEAFILQVEGKKRWRLYKPLNKNEHLPRYSSKNFDQSEIGEPVLDVIVNAGDILYFPRGTIHQGETVENKHSLHITLSVYQKNSWGDFLERLLPETLKHAIESNEKFREGLPLDYLKYTGFVHSENKSDARKSFTQKVKSLLKQLVEHIDIDKAADYMAKSHIHNFLPPSLNDRERDCSVMEDGERVERVGIVDYRVEIEPDTRIRLLRSHCIRLVKEPDTYAIYYSTENSKKYHEYEPQYLEVSEEFVPAVKEIISRYPEYIRVQDLPIDGEDNKVQIARDLWEKCIVVTDHPLPIID